MSVDIEDLDYKIGFSRPCNNDLGASIKIYDVHVILFTDIPSNVWPSKIGKEIFGLEQLQVAKKKFSETNDLKMMLHVCEDSTPRKPNTFTIYCAMSRGAYLITDLTEEKFDNLFQFIGSCENSGKGYGLSIEKDLSLQVFVCAHTNRDERCGYCGDIIHEQFIQEFAKKLESDNFRGNSRKIAHIGGHTYAANVIAFPSGDWFGNVKPQDVKRIISYYEKNETNIQKLGDLWRGRMGMSKEEQLQLTPHPKLEKSESKKFEKKKEKKKLAEKENKLNKSSQKIEEEKKEEKKEEMKEEEKIQSSSTTQTNLSEKDFSFSSRKKGELMKTENIEIYLLSVLVIVLSLLLAFF